MWQRYNGTSKIFEVSTDDGGSWLPLDLDAAIITQGEFDVARIPDLDAAIITTGTFAKAVQHAQTAYKDAANVFSVAANEFQELLLVDKGLTFPGTQVPSAGANDLDDYEEGTWTPSLKFGGNAVGMTYATQTGRYTKAGRLVVLEGSITLTAKGSSVGAPTVTGIPFSPGVTGATCTLDSAVGVSALTAGLFAVISGATIFIFGNGVNGRLNLTDANFANNAAFTFSLAYFV